MAKRYSKAAHSKRRKQTSHVLKNTVILLFCAVSIWFRLRRPMLLSSRLNYKDLESRLQSHRTTVDGLKTTMDSQNARMKAIRSLNDYSATYKSLKPVYDGLQKIKFEKSRAKYKTEHADKLKMFYTARRKLTEEFPDGKVDMGKLSKEYDTLKNQPD